MIGTRLHKQHRMGAIAMAALLMAGATSFMIVQQRVAVADTKLQALADEAALAGVNALAATEGQTDAKRIEAANAAVRKVTAARAELTPIVTPSIDDLTMSVALTSSNTGRGRALLATARYVTAGSAVSPGQTAAAVTKKRTRG